MDPQTSLHPEPDFTASQKECLGTLPGASWAILLKAVSQGPDWDSSARKRLKGAPGAELGMRDIHLDMATPPANAHLFAFVC